MAELVAALLCASWSAPALAQSDAPQMTLTVAAGRPLDILLDQRVVIKSVGQPIDGVLVQSLYAYDRVVVPAGTRVHGHVEALDPQSTFARVRAILSGDLTPPRHVVLLFETFEMASGESIPIESTIKSEIPRPARSTAPPPSSDASDTTVIGSARREATDRAKAAISDARQRARDVLGEFRRPGKGARLRDAIVQRLPYHPHLIAAGTGYHAELTAPLTFGSVTPAARASADVRPAPSSLLNALLLTNLDSSKTPRGTPIQTIVTEPVFSANHELIVGTDTASCTPRCQTHFTNTQRLCSGVGLRLKYAQRVRKGPSIARGDQERDAHARATIDAHAHEADQRSTTTAFRRPAAGRGPRR